MITTRVAALGFPEHRFRGYAVFGELVAHESTAGLIALAIGGRRLTPEEVAILDDLAAVLLVADPRIWPLKLIRVVASYGGILAGYAAGHMVVEGDRIGPPTARYAAELLVSLRDAVGDRLDDRDVVAEQARQLVQGRKRLIGYGIPFRAYDERFVALRERVVLRGRAQLPYFRLQEVLTEVVKNERRLPPNIGIGTAALLLDMGFDPVESAAIIHFLNQPVFIANAFEAGTEPSPELRVLPPGTIAYSGRGPRRSPRSEHAVSDDRTGSVLPRRR